MPVVYDQPDPFAPGISSAYGAAQQFSQDAPMIAGLAEHAASMNQSNNQNASQMRFAYANANAQAQNEQANRYAATQAAQANREQSGMELGAQLQTQGNLAQAHIDAGRAQQHEGAMLQDWLNGREITQKETARYQQMNAAVADIRASTLPAEQKEAAILQLKTGIDSYRQRQELAQAKNLEMLSKQHDLATQLEAKKLETMTKVQAMSAPQRIMQNLTPEAEAEIDSQNLSPSERDAAVKAAKKAGKFDTFLIKADGSLEHVKRGAPEKVEKFDSKHALEVAQIAADSVEPRETGLSGKPEPNQKNTQRVWAEYQRLQAEHQAAHGKGATVAPGVVAPPVGGTKSENHAEMAGQEIAAKVQELQARQDIPPQVKTQATFVLQEAQSMLQAAGGKVDDLKPEQRKVYDNLKQTFRNMIPPVPAAPPSRNSADVVRQQINATRNLLPQR